MASPQTQNGYTQIANELLDAFCYAFPGGSQARLLLAIIRRTYGWRKKEDHISISQLQQMTGHARRTVIYALQNLEAQRFITIQRQRGRGHHNEPNTVALQKNHDLWVVQRNSPQYENQLRKQRGKYHAKVVQRNEGGAKNDPKVVQRIAKNSEIFAPTKERKKTKEKNISLIKKKHGEFQNVLLTEEEYRKLQDQLGTETQALIERLSAYMESRGKRYKSHYATILNWKRRDNGKTRNPRDRNPRQLPKEYSDSPDYPD